MNVRIEQVDAHLSDFARSAAFVVASLFVGIAVAAMLTSAL